MITRKKLIELRNIKNKPSVSLYIPTLIAGDYDKNRIRWKNVVQDSLNQLEEQNVKNAKDILEPALKYCEETKFWANHSKGFCGFFNEDIAQFFHLNQKVEELSFVGDKFILHPLLPETTNEDRIFVLAISQNDVRFFKAQKDGIYPVKISQNVVLSREEALRNIEEDQSLQHHSIGGGDAYYHGNGPGDDMDTTRIKQYLRRVDDGLMEFIHDERVPLVLASVEEYHPLYKEVTNYNHFSDHMIVGNPENMDPATIHDHLQPVFKALKEKRVTEFKNNYEENVGHNLSTSDFDDIAQAAKYENIDSLVIDRNHYAQLDNEQLKKLEETIMNVYQNGGTIHTVKTEEDEQFEMKAIKRFEMEIA